MKNVVKIDVGEEIKDRLETNINLIIESTDTDEISCLCGSAFEDIILACALEIITDENMDELVEQVCDIADNRIRELKELN